MVFIIYLIWKRVVLRDLSESEEMFLGNGKWTKKLIFVLKVMHYDSLSKVIVSP